MSWTVFLKSDRWFVPRVNKSVLAPYLVVQYQPDNIRGALSTQQKHVACLDSVSRVFSLNTGRHRRSPFQEELRAVLTPEMHLPPVIPHVLEQFSHKDDVRVPKSGEG